jgi:hypothetical protein
MFFDIPCYNADRDTFILSSIGESIVDAVAGVCTDLYTDNMLLHILLVYATAEPRFVGVHLPTVAFSRFALL